jgi:Outer membrane protein beta-barrel domain
MCLRLILLYLYDYTSVCPESLTNSNHKPMRQFISLCLALMANFTVPAQHQFGVKINIGSSLITHHFETNPSQNETTANYPRPSGQAGFIYNYRFGQKFSFGAEALYIPIYGHEYLKLPFTDENGDNIGESENHTYRHIHYIGLPLYIGYHMKKLGVHIGFQANWALASGGKAKSKSTLNGTDYESESSLDELQINKFDYGPRVGLTYTLSDKWSLETNYYQGLTNLVKASSFKSYLTVRIYQWSVGMRYVLFTGGQKADEPDVK